MRFVRWILFGLIILVTLGIGYLVGQQYGSMPFALGGGEPEQVRLIFRDENVPAMLGLSAVSGTYSNISKELELIAYLVDGFLVHDLDTGVVTAIKQDDLIARQSILKAVSSTGTQIPISGTAP